jgi:hypothetical protein
MQLLGNLCDAAELTGGGGQKRAAVEQRRGGVWSSPKMTLGRMHEPLNCEPNLGRELPLISHGPHQLTLPPLQETRRTAQSRFLGGQIGFGQLIGVTVQWRNLWEAFTPIPKWGLRRPLRTCYSLFVTL